ncbi:MAG: CRTAC1 family protein [Planctomycetes bacterium]|nr:CRTAC1 family protein [Planctomycetota bacterium]
MSITLLFVLIQTAPAPAASGPASRPAQNIQLIEVDAVQAGIDFVHKTGASGQKFVVETMGSGVGVFDADGDGNLDIYFAQGAPLPGCAEFDSRSKLYLGDGNWHFRDASDSSGCADAGYAMGVAVGDINNDGNLDMYVSAYGRGHLFLNKGSAKFVDITESSGVIAAGFLSSAAFGDLDRDGFVDLYIANYLDLDEVKKNPYCGKHLPGGRAYCSPHAFSGGRDFLYKNLKNGSFQDVSAETGVARAGKTDGKGLGVVMSDFDGDGNLDIAVANDSCANYLYKNNGNWKFTEIAAVAGVAFAEDGQERAGMGIDAADVDGDGKPELFITNLAAEPNSLFHNVGNMIFDDWSGVSGLGPPSIPFVGFGCGLVDLDGDGDRDAIVVNGHILDNAELFGDMSPYRQRPLVFENINKGKFRLIKSDLPFFATPRVLRGLAFGDFDHDGDVDAVASPPEGRPVLLRNESAPSNGRIIIRFKATISNRSAIGVKVEWQCAGAVFSAQTKTGFSYLSSSDVDLAIGCGTADRVDRISVTWPSGKKSEFKNLAANHTFEITESNEMRDVGTLRNR